MNRENLYNILMADDIRKSIRENIKYILEEIPELCSLMSTQHMHPHHIDGSIWDHVLLALKISDGANNEYRRELSKEKVFDVRLALLFHDLGKTSSLYDKPDETGVKHYHGHATESARLANFILQRMGFDINYINYICYLISYHDTPINDVSIDNNYDICEVLYEVQRCDALAHHPDHLEKRKKYLSELKEKLDAYKQNKDNLITPKIS